MQVVFHIGAHCTDGDQLVRTLLKNRGLLARRGVVVPGPGRYRRVLGEVLGLLDGAPVSAEAEEAMLDGIVETDAADRLILSDADFLCPATEVLADGELYGAVARSARLAHAFPSAEIGFALGLRNLASFLPALSEATGTGLPPRLDPRALSWVGVVEGLRAANPEAEILVWCDEDTPLLWPEILRELAALDPTDPVEGSHDLARRLLGDEGNARYARFLERWPPADEYSRRRALAAHLAKYATDEALEQEIGLDGWTEELVEELSAAYEEDLEEIATIPGVMVLTA